MSFLSLMDTGFSMAHSGIRIRKGEDDLLGTLCIINTKRLTLHLIIHQTIVLCISYTDTHTKTDATQQSTKIKLVHSTYIS